MKKLFSVFLSVLMIFSVYSVACTAADSVELKLTSEKVYAGDEFSLNLFISDNSQMSGAVIDLSYDSDKLEYVSAEPGAILDQNANISIRNIDGKNPYVRFTYLAPSSSVTSAGVILTVKFKALSNATGKTEIKISVPNAGDFITSDLEKISYTAVNSTVEIIGTGSTAKDPFEDTNSEGPIESQTVEETESNTETQTQTEESEITTELPTQNDDGLQTGTATNWVAVAVFAVVAFIAVAAIVAAVVIFIVLKSNKKK
ncbi:MAG: hypothetical protein J1F23_07145 [Oscillospiraceae bacterium]|nr:hypothetical protein [Oscillospiraceae bacterium]